MSNTETNAKILEDTVRRIGREKIQNSLDETIEDIVMAADMDKKTKEQLRVILALKRVFRNH